MEQCRRVEMSFASSGARPVQLSASRVQEHLREAEQGFQAAGEVEASLKSRDAAFAELLFWLYVSQECLGSIESGARLQELIGNYCLRQLSPQHAEIVQKPFDESLWKAGMSLSLLTERKFLQQAGISAFRLEKIPDYFFFYSSLFRRHTGSGMEDVLFRSGFGSGPAVKQEVEVLRLRLLKWLSGAEVPSEAVLAVPSGLPGAVAFRIGICFYCGYILKCDHLRAWQFIAYAFLVGSPEAATAYGLFFASFNLYSDRAEEPDSCANFFYLYLHALLLSRAVRKQGGMESRIFALLLSPHPGGEFAFEEETLFNFCCLCLHLYHSGESTGKSRVEHCTEFLFGEFKELLALHDSFRLRAALVLALEFTRKEHLSNLAGLLCSICGAGPKGADNVALGELCRRALRRGVQEGDPDSVMVQFLSFSFDPDDESCLLAAKKLAAGGSGEATFVLGSKIAEGLQESPLNDVAVMHTWEQATEQESSVAMFNRSLALMLQKDFEEAGRLAFAALSSGNAESFYVLYRACRERHPEFACTCLRYAAEYLSAPALQELEELRESGLYSPHPFMCSIEKLEELAQHSPTACKCLATLYINSGIMPTDPFKYLQWLRQAVMLGDTSLLDSLVIMYNCFLFRDNTPFYLPSLKKAMQRSCMYGHNHADPDDPDARAATSLLKDIRKQLAAGETLMEKQLYLNALKCSFWTNSSSQDQAEEFVNAHPEAGMFYLYEKYMRLLGGHYAESLLDSEYSDFRARITLAEKLQRFADEPLLSSLKALLCLRGCNAPPDFAAFRRYVQKGSAFENPFSVLLNRMHFDCLQDYMKDDDEVLPSEDSVFVLRVMQ